MKNKKIVIRILLILISILCILLPTKVSAMSQEEAGETIAKYAVNFYNNEEKRNLVIYYGGDDLYTRRGYSTRTGLPWEGSGTYDLDCMGFLSMVVRQATGVIEPDVESGASSYIWPTKYGGNDKPHIIEVVQGELQPGDLLANSHHVMIYVGGGMVVHCAGHYRRKRIAI